MRTIIYNVNTLALVGTVSGTSTADEEISLNVIPNFGGNATDYASISTPLTDFNLSSAEGVVTAIASTPEPVAQTPSLDERVAALEYAIFTPQA